MELILAEQVLLFSLDEEKGSDRTSYGVDPGLSGGLLMDLGRLEAVREEDGKIVVVEGAAPPAHPLLAEALEVIGSSDKRRSAKDWVDRLPRELKPLRQRLAEGLVERGVLAEERRKVLGVFPSTRYPEADPGPERALRERLGTVLLERRDPDPEEAMLLSLLSALELVRGLVPRDRRREAGKRAKQIAEAGLAGQAVAAAVRDVQTAVMTAVIAGGVAGAAGADGGGGG